MRKSSKLLVEKIVSGGQTGADQGALEAAQALGLNTGGWAPPLYMTERGPNIELRTKYNLCAIDGKFTSSSYVKRSKLNVDTSDATIVFRFKSSAGTDKTMGYACSLEWKKTRYPSTHSGSIPTNYKPVFIVSTFNEITRKALRKFLIQHRVRTFNVCGHRTSRGPRLFQVNVKKFLIHTLK